MKWSLMKSRGWDKTAPIAVLPEAKFYLPRQAAAAAARFLSLMYCGSCTAATFKFKAAAVHEPQYTRVKISLDKNTSSHNR